MSWARIHALVGSASHPRPWQVRRFGYERYALLDANQAEVAEFVYEWDAKLCADLVNAAAVPRRLDYRLLAGFVLGVTWTGIAAGIIFWGSQ